MVWIIFILGCAVMAVCLAILIRPELLRRILKFFSIGNRVYLAGLLRIILGVMILVLASQARLWGYVVTIGLLASSFGLSVFVLALRRTKKLLARFINQSNLTLRFYAICGLILWALLIYGILPVR